MSTEPDNDSDVQFVSRNHAEKLICQICFNDITTMTTPQKEHHYEEHFSSSDQPHASESDMSGGAAGVSQPTSSRSRLRSSKPPSKTSVKQTFKASFKPVSSDEKNAFWHSSTATEPPPNFSPGLITVLRKALTRMHDRGTTERAWLALEQSVHVHGEPWDRKWGCGYRNYLMACAALMDQQVQPMYFPLLDAPVPPGILNFQILLERAWRDGYDKEGANELHHKLVDTHKWIGTAELYVAFTYCGIPARLVDFELKEGPEPLLQWIHEYFSGGDPHHKMKTVGEALRGARPVIMTDKLPMVLQHDGHSRTIVGCEQVKGGALNLLAFDPSKKIPQVTRRAGLKYHDPTIPDEYSGKSAPLIALHKVKQTIGAIKSHKRKSPDPQAGPSKKKRLSAADEPDVIVIASDEQDGKQAAGPPPQRMQSDIDMLDPTIVLKSFRIEPREMKKKKYQILYFPLEEPLTDAQKANRRIVTSEKIC